MFEDSKGWLFLILTGVLISLGYGAHYLSAVDEANLALQESKSKLADMKEQVFLRKRDWDDREKAVAKVQEETDKTATLLKAQEVLDKRYLKDETELKYALESMKASVAKIRESAPGTDLGELALANGKVLQGVKIRKVEDSGISLIHSDGIGTIPLDMLPESLKEKYDLGPKALIPMIQKAQTAFLAKPSSSDLKPEPVINKPKPDATTKPATGAIEDSKAKSIRLRMVELDSQIATYTKAVVQFQNAATSHQTLATNAASRGQPTTRHKENANENLVQAAAMERQLAGLREERKKLDIELEHALKNE